MEQELVDKLINHYEKAISAIKDNPFAARRIATEMEVYFGICNVSDVIFDIKIYSDNWIKNKVHFTSIYAYKIPAMAVSTVEILDSLQYRLNLLKNFPN
jgi:hypothetical protein